MNPFFFGTSAQQLYGAHHPAVRDEVRDGAVLLCPPIGHEYIASHGSLQQLATKLALAGFHVLRFDYYATGDSAGDDHESTVEQWVSDVETALEELEDTTGSSRLTVVGLRLGGALAALAARRRQPFAAVLWEPIVRGGPYVEELFSLQQRWIGALYTRPARVPNGAEGPEALGFALPDALQRGVAELDLCALPPPAAHTLVIENETSDGMSALRQAWGGAAGVTFESIPCHPAWMGRHWAAIALPPHDLLGRIVRWVVEVHR